MGKPINVTIYYLHQINLSVAFDNTLVKQSLFVHSHGTIFEIKCHLNIALIKYASSAYLQIRDILWILRFCA